MIEAGRELDQIIAEKVMGQRIIPGTNLIAGSRLSGQWVAEVPHYSTDIAAAWLVVEHMRSRGFYLFMNDTMSQYRCVFYTIEDTLVLNFFDSPTEPRWAFTSTAPHAICVAARAAVGVEC